MSLSEIFQKNQLTLSCEFFPPRTEKGEQSLYRHVESLMHCDPDFMTCTYGAGGSTRDKTLEIVSNIKRQFKIPVASHLTVVDSTIEELTDYLQRATDLEVDYIVALRGDPPQGTDSFVPTNGGLGYANELVDLIQQKYPHFGVVVAGYPEVHRESPSLEDDLMNLKRKVDAGADAIITQLFYHNDDFFRFCDRCRKIGIEVPIIPGLLPVVSLKQIQRIAGLCGARLPQPFIDRLSERDDPEWQFEVGVEQAVAQTESLLEHGVAGLHFYVLNRSDATNSILQAVDIASARAS
ncbi:MAG: methylenetetrahydrofolate reductase [NAD(P)H] [Mariniblastus sp.]|nr:methylenetetrahydrofolate reductase [NAD(P)H] [Mariniblastus sp.]